MSFIGDVEIGDGPTANPGLGGRSFNISANFAGRLPAVAADKLRRLKQNAEDMHSVLLTVHDGLKNSMAEKQRAEIDLRHFLTGRGLGGRGGLESDTGAVKLKKEIEEHLAEQGRLRPLVAEREEHWHRAGELVRHLETFVKELPTGSLVADRPADEPPVIKGGDFSGAIEKVRRRMRELQSDLHSVSTAPRPSAHARKLIANQISKLSQRGSPDVLTVVEAGDPLRFPSIVSRTRIEGGRGLAIVEQPDIYPFLCWLLGDLLTEKINQEISLLQDDAAALSDADRERRTQEINSDINATGWQEESVLLAAEASGVQVERRPDASPLAVLGIVVITPANEGVQAT